MPNIPNTNKSNATNMPPSTMGQTQTQAPQQDTEKQLVAFLEKLMGEIQALGQRVQALEQEDKQENQGAKAGKPTPDTKEVPPKGGGLINNISNQYVTDRLLQRYETQQESPQTIPPPRG